MKDWFVEMSRKWLWEFLCKKIFGSVIGGVKGFIAKWLFGKLWGEILKPLILKAWRKTVKFFNRIKYKKKAEALRESKTEDEFNSAVDDLP